MRRIELNETERQALWQVFKTTSEVRPCHRCQAVLMASHGRARGQIAQDLGVDPKTVCRWLRIYQDRGLAGLPSRWAPGRTPYIPETLAPELLEGLKQGPVAWGLSRANWSYPELADYLYKSHGIAVKESAMRHFCHKQGIRPYRPTYRFLRGDPERQAKAREDLGELKKSPHW